MQEIKQLALRKFVNIYLIFYAVSVQVTNLSERCLHNRSLYRQTLASSLIAHELLGDGIKLFLTFDLYSRSYYCFYHATLR